MEIAIGGRSVFNYRNFYSRRKSISKSNNLILPVCDINNIYTQYTLAIVLATEIFINKKYIKLEKPIVDMRKFILTDFIILTTDKKEIDLYFLKTYVYQSFDNKYFYIIFFDENHDTTIFSKKALISYVIANKVFINPRMNNITETSYGIYWSMVAENEIFEEWVKYFLNTYGLLSSETLINKWKKRRGLKRKKNEKDETIVL